MKRTILATGLLLALVSSLAHAQVCPQSQYQHPLRPPGVQTTTAARLLPVTGYDVSFDLPTGRARLTLGGGDAFMTTRDTYRIVGPGTAPVSGLATLEITYSMYANQTCHEPNYVAGTVTVSEGAQSRSLFREANCVNGLFNQTERLHLPISHVPGEPFTLAYDLRGTGSFTTLSLDVQFGFSNLPPGYTVQSCQNFAYAPVATARSSWGAVKSYYR